jgi:hypothetical protein
MQQFSTSTGIKPTLVFGASDNPDRTSYTALHMLREHGVEVHAFGLRAAEVAGVQIEKDTTALQLPALHTITMYMGAARQAPFEAYLLGLKPQRIIFISKTYNSTPKNYTNAISSKCRGATIDTPHPSTGSTHHGCGWA